ncbi:MAG: GIY-YIG nuclease family protein [FCB group bacterium]|nr:GIY-YIG nuclease family protein [FCB group bacterium]MBL7027406.1 GIY-YIG nuclease family protein [Candidatus Neomarinimicrobiota bacterium]MBL7122612.1 GIY-YIG nuclease family protein [Candidatus Neomarinimicrobiota bacterium]
MKQGQVYILECSDSLLYTGVTSNLENRLAQHHEGNFPGYTHSRRPIKLLWNTDLMDIQDAIVLERQIKNWGHSKKRALIEENWDTLHLLAECKNQSHHNNFSLDSARDDEDNIHERDRKFRKFLL